jgi:hypothetical protein
MVRRRFVLATVAAAAAARAAAAAQSPRPELRLSPEIDFNRLAAGAPAGARILLAPGRYPGWSAVPKDGQTFEAEGEGAVRPGLLAGQTVGDDRRVGLAGSKTSRVDPGGNRSGSKATRRSQEQNQGGRAPFFGRHSLRA